MAKIELKDLSPEAIKELEKRAKQELENRAKKRQEDREAYKSIVNEVVPKFVELLIVQSKELGDTKQRVFEGFADVLKMKADLYDVDMDKQQSHTFSNLGNTARIILGHNMTDAYDDTVNAGIEKVKIYLESLANDETRELVTMVQKLLAKDASGNLKASRVLQLTKIAKDSGNAEFIDAVEIIQAAYKPVMSKQYIKAEYRKEEGGAWISIPLSVTEAKAQNYE